uniref:Protein tyrosine phosphatase receptor type N n=1 Tax=Astyanax mexicanus TaxID=7994 RepID=A0A8B9LTR1_ASTMX
MTQWFGLYVICLCLCVFCITDRLFGQCRSSRQDQVQYQVSVPVLQRLQEVLKELMMQGTHKHSPFSAHYSSLIYRALSKLSMFNSQQVVENMSSHTYSPFLYRSAQHSPKKAYSNSKTEPRTPQSYMDYVILDPHQSPSLHMQAVPLDPYAYLQEDISHSLNSHAGVGYQRPSSRSGSQQQQQRDRDRQLLEKAVSHYLSAQHSFLHRGAAGLPASSYYEDLDFPLDYGEDYTLQERPSSRQRTNKKVPQDYSSLSGLDDDTMVRLAAVLERMGMDPQALSPQQLNRFALLLQFLQSDVTENTEHIHQQLCVCVCICSVVGPALTFRIRQNSLNLSAEDVANKAVAEKNFLEGETGLKIIQTGVGERSEGLPQATRIGDGSRGVVLTMVAMACVGAVVLVALTIACLRHHARQLASGKLGLGPEAGAETHFDYQELCRQHMAAKSSFSRPEPGGRRGTDTSRVSSVSSQFSDGPQHSPSSHSSTPSWSEEPAQSNMDISTGHMILAYMEDHLKNKDRLQKEWEALCSYQAEPSSVSIAQNERNLEKNRYPDFVPYDHSRVKLKPEVNPNREDYINASIIIDHDPRMPAYIATQGPLPHTIADFWQMVWENGCTVIVMMTALLEDGEQQCERYWPDEGSSLYNIYEVNLVSEHIWCKDFLVRSFYLKNVQTQETRTLTQFHLLSWPAQGIPTSTRPLLDFRRKVNKCYRGRSCPIIVHCSEGTGRTGTYILIDMVLNRMAKGVKEIDIAATLEHIRDQRQSMVRTKDQFEFALTAVAEEVNAILKALPQ